MRLEGVTDRRRQTRFDAARTKLVRIKTVVNVVYKTAEQNISDAQINSQIAALNKDYRAKNSDRNQTPAPWKGPRDRRPHGVQISESDAHPNDRELVYL
jgi:hypothetical protein